MLNARLRNYSGAYIFAKGTILIPNTTAAGPPANNNNKKVVFKNYTPFSDCISKIIIIIIIIIKTIYK